jgi:hypothetical protein
VYRIKARPPETTTGPGLPRTGNRGLRDIGRTQRIFPRQGAAANDRLSNPETGSDPTRNPNQEQSQDASRETSTLFTRSAASGGKNSGMKYREGV